MNLSPDRFKIVCPQADKDGFHCPGADPFGACRIYTNFAVRDKAREEKGCAYRRLRKPVVEKKKGAFINPLKASKQKVKA